MLRAAVALADESGIESLSMRRLGQELGVEAMSLYNHVANKDDLLNGITDLVLREIELPERRRLEGGPAPACDLGPRRPRLPSLGVQPRAVAGPKFDRLRRAGGVDAATAPRGRLLARGDLPRVPRPRRPHPRLHALAAGPRDRRRRAPEGDGCGVLSQVRPGRVPVSARARGSALRGIRQRRERRVRARPRPDPRRPVSARRPDGTQLTVRTTLPVFCPVSTYRCASTTSSSG